MIMRAAGLITLATAAVILAACGSGMRTVTLTAPKPSPNSGTVSANVAAGSAKVPRGETLVVNLGPVSPGIGDQWFVIRRPDPSVLRDNGMQLSDCSQPGCTGTGSWRFRAVRTGATSVSFQYCFRSAPPRCEPAATRGPSRPVTLRITVT